MNKKSYFLTLAIIFTLLQMGCGMNSTTSTKKKSTTQASQPAPQVTAQAQDTVVKPEAPIGKNLAEDIPGLPSFDPTAIELKVKDVEDFITIEIVSDQRRFGDVKEIKIDLSQNAFYFAHAMLPEGGIPKLIVSKILNGGNYWQKEYPLVRVIHPPQPITAAYQSDNDKNMNIRKFGVPALFVQVQSAQPIYEASLIDGQWQAKFTDLQFKQLAQVREEQRRNPREASELQEIEKDDGVNFATMAVEMFQPTLSLPAVQAVLKDQHLESLTAQDVISISNYISIYAIQERMDITTVLAPSKDVK